MPASWKGAVGSSQIGRVSWKTACESSGVIRRKRKMTQFALHSNGEAALEGISLPVGGHRRARRGGGHSVAAAAVAARPGELRGGDFSSVRSSLAPGGHGKPAGRVPAPLGTAARSDCAGLGAKFCADVPRFFLG